MREIKFRVWDKKKRIMIKPDYIGVNNLGNIFYYSALADDWCTAPNPEDVVLLQYTGLKDRHGKEIYEGDIVKYLDTIFGSDNKTAVVVYKYDRFIAEGFDNTYGINWEKLEVIGNIYEKGDN